MRERVCVRERRPAPAGCLHTHIYVHTLVDIASRAWTKGPFSLVLHDKRAVRDAYM
jgi:hypothetical protein